MNGELDRLSTRVSRRTVLGLAAAAGITLAACGRSDDGAGATSTDAADLRGIAADAYVFGYPLVLMDATRTAFEAIVPTNRFLHADSLPTPARRDLVRVNIDTLYSISWLDLAAEPIVLRVPAVESGRFWVMQFLDAWTNTVHSPGSIQPRVGPDAPGPPYTYVVTGPGWAGGVPDDVVRLEMPTPTVWLIGRIQVDGVEDVPAVRARQRELALVPLGDWLAGRPAPEGTVKPVETTTPPAFRVGSMDANSFFTRLCALMAVNPPAPEDAPALARFARIGIRPGGAVTGISAADLTAGVATARRQLPTYTDPDTTVANGWEYSTQLGDYGTDYRLRARVAQQGLGANLPEHAIYPNLDGLADTDGTPNRYRLRFPPDQIPPVDAFWSITAYDGDGFLIPHPSGVHSVGHHIPPVPNPDGSLEIAVQYENPGSAVPPSNWLPIPDAGPFSLTMRLYAPQPSVLRGEWRPPALEPAP
ncbi:DUF1254 domain-containing protein [Nocardia otitidiscaviarum]|uniref:DUF1254 domain-containing protein n=1 Tax=Nocardia otitidiscaviarum TaxID=1823 RepID=UPI0004A6A94D|nr:DUF1254 domain-containing protein [Nocardia otitidiscaviarum]MBF6133211.1 DUF1254 domain-containing protein [Nocardia otitidiscaviarum]MBF6486607.1 DUF1254 domain-containing protein [Nocardia otitidiscaviarum]